MADQFEWDEAKNASNLKKHGIRFEEAATIFDGPVVTRTDPDHINEVRERSYGLLGGTIVVCVVHTDRHGKIRIITARKATRGERKMFNVHLT
ncbi:BrnT family toxin [Aurantimonas sp. NFXS3]|uniref:BrnT family toxin n=1 Tax=Aurantimonas sp. NFXS3 TaxID=2818434 RepID=UPI003B8CE35B